jgi:ligand-binding sensor domain-containing protein
LEVKFFGAMILGLLIWLGAALASGAAELPPYRVDSWQVDDGLPQSSVLSIVQTRDGYLWLGTAGGLVRFDGVQFKVFTPDNSPGLPSNRILSLYEGASGALWLGTIEGYMTRYVDRKFQISSPDGWVKLSGYIQNFGGTPDGKLWLLSPNKELIYFPEAHPALTITNSKVQQVGVNSMTVNAAGQIWSATDREVGVWENEKFTSVFDVVPTGEFSPVILANSRDGGCWVAGNGQVRKFKGVTCVTDYGKYPWPKGSPVCMVEDRLGQLWVGTYGSGVYCFATNGAAERFAVEERLPGNFVRSLCEDREGNIWVGLEGAGLARVKPVVFRSLGREQGLSGDCVLSVCEGAAGELWIGYIADGLDRWQNGVVQHFGPAQGLPNDYIHTVFLDRKQRLWVGTWGSGLCRFDGSKFVSHVGAEETNGVVCALFEDSKNRLWLGQQRSQPEIVFLENDQPVVLRLQSRRVGTDVRAVTEDRDGNIWIGTQGDGLYRLKDGQQTHFTLADGLSNETVRSLYADEEGTLWIATFGGGLNRFKDGKFTSFTTKAGLPHDSLGAILEDPQGNLWCGSLAGVFRVNKVELDKFARGETQRIHCLQFTKSDGLPSLECNGGNEPSACRTRDGRLWFPTVKGLAVVNPDNVPINQLVPPVAIQELVIEGRERQAIADVAISTRSNNAAVPLEIAPGARRLEFHYTGLSFTDPFKVRFRYKLDGLEDEWTEAGPRRTAYYIPLEPGHYQFRVQACNNDGVWNEIGAAVALNLLPRFWQTWWFKTLCVLAVILIFVGIYEIRLASERKLARVRLRIASDLHDEVGSNLGSIVLLSEMVPAGGEEADEIRRVSRETVGSLRDIVWFLDPASDNMNDLVLRMKDTTRTLLPGIPHEFTVVGEIHSVRPSLNIRRNVFPMFKEILHNIAKHAKAQRVDIRVQMNARDFQIHVRDDGIGFDETQVRHGNGLKNLRRRATELSGAVEVQSRPGHGSRFTVTVPITRMRGGG